MDGNSIMEGMEADAHLLDCFGTDVVASLSLMCEYDIKQVAHACCRVSRHLKMAMQMQRDPLYVARMMSRTPEEKP